MSRVFISYCHSDHNYANKFAAALHHKGFPVWLDLSINTGDRWFETIVDEIRKCSVFIVVMSPEAEESEWVEKEILIAQKYCKPILPLLVRGEVFEILIATQYQDVRNGELPPPKFYEVLSRLIATETSSKSKGDIDQPVANKSSIESRNNKVLAEQLITFLENRRVLFNPRSHKCPIGAVKSVQQIRVAVQDVLEKTSRNSKIFNILSDMHGATLDFLEYACGECKAPVNCGNCMVYEDGCVNGLTEFRKRMGKSVNKLVVEYELYVRKRLGTILP